MTSMSAGKSRAAPTSSQDGATPSKRSRFDLTPEDPMPSTSTALSQVSSVRDMFTDDDHKALDAMLFDAFSTFKELKRMPALPFLLVNILGGDKRLVRLGYEDVEELLKDQPSIEGILKNAWEAGSFKEVRRLEILWPQVSSRRQPDYAHVSQNPYELATVQSWDINYVGDVDDLLYQYLCQPTGDNTCARYTSIVQSSGTGKSRAIDELSKKHLVVPLCLREGSSGFPPPDGNVRDWFRKGETKIGAFARAGAFLCALFIVLLRCLQQIDEGIASNSERAKSRAARFRQLMRAEQTFSRYGQPHQQFYEDVLQLADRIWSRPLPSTPDNPMPPPPALSFNIVDGVKYDLTEAIDELMKYLIPDFDVLNPYDPALIISFDEAHSMATTKNDPIDGSWSIFSELRRVLGVIRSRPCFSVFLSTAGKITQFTPAAINNPSNRLQVGRLNLLPPFCELGFDQLAQKAVCGRTTLDDVSSTEFMASLGRPLFASRYIAGNSDVRKLIVEFAGEKLLCKGFATDEQFVRHLTPMEKLAIISVRIPLEFSVTTLDSQDKERTLVEKHMRICLSVDSGFETAVTVAPSEPILAEASYHVMRSPLFNLPRSLLAELEYPGFDKGSRGEHIVMTLCLGARDAAAVRLRSRIIPVDDFIRELIAPAHHEEVLFSMPIRARTADEADSTLADTFSKSHIYFNHFIKLRDFGVISQKYLCGLIVRGAAAICADLQHGINIIVPFLYRDKDLLPENVSAFIIQSKNDKSFQANPCQHLFDVMDPCEQFFAENGAVPVIRMVFALGCSTSCVTVLKGATRTQPSRKAASKAKFQAHDYTTFDIWCGKASHETFKVIKESDDNIFRDLLLRSRGFPDVYERKQLGVRNLTRSMNPGTGDDEAHWQQFHDL